MSVLKDLIARRVPHILGFYFAAGWAALEFTTYVVDRFVLSPHLADLALMIWALMIPTVLLLAYYHGRPGPDEWTIAEKVGIPINVVLAGALLFFSFEGKELGAATTQVTVEDETGQLVERVVPKGALMERLAIYSFDSQAADTALDWLQYGIPLAVEHELLQDIFVSVHGYDSFQQRLTKEGYPDGVGAPLALRRDIAEKLHLEHFVSGSVEGSPDSLRVMVSLYDVRRGKLIQERTFTGSDLFRLVDEISVQLKRDLGVPEQHIEEGRDLPFADLATNSVTAFRSFVEGVRALAQERWIDAAEALSSAVEEDPGYAMANYYLFNAHLLVNDSENANAALQAALDQKYKLPERIQFILKVNYYILVKPDAEKARRVAGMMTELFPEDVIGHSIQLQLRTNAGEREKAIASAKRILELDPGELRILSAIGDLYQQLGQYAEAQSYYEQYAAEAPTDPRAFNDLGDLSRALGEHDRALDYYERALLLETDNVPVLIDMAQTEAALGRFERASAQLEEAIQVAATATQRAQAYDALRSLHERRGEMRRAIEYMHLSWAELDKGAPLVAIMSKLGDLDTYVKGRQPERAQAMIDEFQSQLGPPLDLLIAIGQLSVARELEDAEAIERALEGMGRLMEALGFEVLRPLAVAGRGKLLEIQGDFEGAIVAYERAIELVPALEVDVNAHIGRCYNELGRHEEAIERLQRVLILEPFAPEAHFELARAYAESGQSEKAVEHLELALQVWENADPAFEPAQEARADLDALTPSA